MGGHLSRPEGRTEHAAAETVHSGQASGRLETVEPGEDVNLPLLLLFRLDFG